jgi:SAM-dependent methyltransferase
LNAADTPPPAEAPSASFRDPAGVVWVLGNRILRIVNPAGIENLTCFVESAELRKRVASGDVVRTIVLENPRDATSSDPALGRFLHHTAGAVLLEHERIEFPSFPYEWPPEMLHAAASLTLDLAQSLLIEGIGLKDATPYNILFRGSQPVFIDVLSFERRDQADPIWLPYAQFVRTFLLPLAASRYLGIGLDQTLTTRRDGLEPQDLYRAASFWRRLRPPLLQLSTLPHWLERRHDPGDQRIYQRRLTDPERAHFVLQRLFHGLRRNLAKVGPQPGATSAWSAYEACQPHYSPEEGSAKRRFVSEALAEFAPKRVLDVGSNTGEFSVMAAATGAAVVAIDSDPVVVGTLWRRARAKELAILPLVVNLARPTPGMGWRNREWPSFLERADGGFDAVLLLAALHHLLVMERVPLPSILALAAELTRDLVIVEFVAPEDPMFERLTRGRAELHRGLNHDVFENFSRERFDIIRAQHLPGATRRLYVLRKRT